MTWTYSLALAAAKDQIRLLVGDTDIEDQQLQDEEIAYFVSSEANTRMAASRCASAVGAKYTRKADKAMGDLKISYNAIAAKYVTLAAELRNRAMVHQVPSAGGILVTEQQAYEDNGALRHNSVKRGMHDLVSSPTRPNTEGS